MITLAVVLTPDATGSQVILDGADITESVRGLDISAHVGHPLEITLSLIGTVELVADIARIAVEKEAP